MRGLNDFIAWLYIMFTIVIGVMLMLTVGGWYGLHDKMDVSFQLLLNSSAGIWAGLGLVVIGLLFMALRVKSGKKKKSISFENPEGEVTISIKAIEDFVKKMGQEFADVVDMVPFIMPYNDGIKVSAKTSILGGTNVPKLAENIQQEIKSRMQNILGIENVTSVEINVAKLVNRKKGDAGAGQENFEYQQQVEEYKGTE